MKVVNHTLYLLSDDYKVYKANKNGTTHAIPYTTEKKISEPSIVKKYSKLKWGISGNQIYLAEDNKTEWHRENALEFTIADFKLLSDSIAILWDGTKNNYLYSLHDHTSKIFFPDLPITKFLTSPIQSFSINSGSQGCYHNKKNEVKYERVDDSTFTTSSFTLNDNQDKKTYTFKSNVKSNLFLIILNSINTSPSSIPSLKDFQITEKDKKNYLDIVAGQINSKEIDFSTRKKKINKTLYYSVPSILDTLNGSIIKEILEQQEGVWSTTNNWFTIQLVNQNSDTVNISREYYLSSLPWNLPWKYEYNGLNFNCYNIEFSKFINSCIPDNFIDKKIFDNRILIMQIADYLYNKP